MLQPTCAPPSEDGQRAAEGVAGRAERPEHSEDERPRCCSS